jgi:hypothetical protein
LGQRLLRQWQVAPLKMLCHLWADTKFPDGATARSLVPSMPDDLRSLLRELDTAGKRAGGVFSAAGALPSGTTDHVRRTILSVIFAGADLPRTYPQAQFVLWLKEKGGHDVVRAAVEHSELDWVGELNDLYVSDAIAAALLEWRPSFAANEGAAKELLCAQFRDPETDITTDQFVREVKRVLKLVGRDGRMPCALIVLDEVQQYISDSNDRAMLVTEVTEALSKQLDSHVIVVASGQSALTATPKLQKLTDRYTIRVQLSDQDVEAVIRKVLLQKKPASISTVREFLEKHGGEVSRQLQGTRIGETAQDRDFIVDDYPLLPVRRRFWEHCFRAVDAAGTHSQLRSQLCIIHDAVARLCERGMGATVPGDELFEALAPEMVNTGVLLREINERIINLSKDGTDESKLARRICGLVFLISRLPREAGSDIGVHATKEHIADLLVDDLLADNGKLRSSVEIALEKLAASGALMKVDDDYRLQTKEGAEWDAEFRRRQSKLANDDADIQIRRDQLLYADADKIIRAVKIVQGAAKEARQVVISREQTPPTGNGENVPLWLRDGWSSSEKDILDAARSAGTDSPTVFVFLRGRLPMSCGSSSSMPSLPSRPSTPRARRPPARARRRNTAWRAVETAPFGSATSSSSRSSPTPGCSRAAAPSSFKRASKTASARRRTPRSSGSSRASRRRTPQRGRLSSSAPRRAPISRSRRSVTPDRPSSIRSARRSRRPSAPEGGGDVRKTLRASPYGWPQDAIDAALIALHRTQHLSATWNGAVLAPGQVDQGKISKAEFRVEKVTLTVTETLAIRKVFQALGVSCKAGEELAKGARVPRQARSARSGDGR